MPVLASVAAAVLLAQAAPARGEAPLPRKLSDEDRIGFAIQDTLVKHGAEVHRCFEKALADRLDVAGRCEIRVDLNGGAQKTSIESADPGVAPVARCLMTAMTTWKIPVIEQGTSVVFPFAFEAQPAQFTIKTADAPDRGPGVPKNKAGKPIGDVPPFSVKLLIDEATMRARQASMSLLTISPANRIAMHRHPGAEIVYVVKGHARLLGPAGFAPQKLDEGMAALIAPGMPHVLENMGRQTPAVLLQIFAPMGPERVYRDPRDATGRAAFEVIRDARTAKAPEGPPAPVTVAAADKVAPLPIAAGKGRVRILLAEGQTGSGAASLDVLEFDPGAAVPRHQHPGAAEMLYVVAGTGELEIGSDKVPFGPETAIHIPEDQPHAAKFTGPDKAIVIQIYAPAGPEQRFKEPAPTPPGSPAAAPFGVPGLKDKPALPPGDYRAKSGKDEKKPQ